MWREKRAPDPLFPLPVFRNPSIWRSDLLAACHGAVLVSLITYLPIYLRVSRGATAGEIGLFLLPMMAGVGTGSMTTGQIVSRTGRTAIVPSCGLLVVIAGLLVLAFFADRMTNLELSLFLAFTALFIGTVMGVVQVTVQSAAGSAMLGTAAASVQFSRSLGAALGTATVGAVLFAVLTTIDPQRDRDLRQPVPGDLGPAEVPRREPPLPPSRTTSASPSASASCRSPSSPTCAAMLAWTIPLRRI